MRRPKQNRKPSRHPLHPLSSPSPSRSESIKIINVNCIVNDKLSIHLNRVGRKQNQKSNKTQTPDHKSVKKNNNFLKMNIYTYTWNLHKNQQWQQSKEINLIARLGILISQCRHKTNPVKSNWIWGECRELITASYRITFIDRIELNHAAHFFFLMYHSNPRDHIQHSNLMKFNSFMLIFTDGSEENRSNRNMQQRLIWKANRVQSQLFLFN